MFFRKKRQKEQEHKTFDSTEWTPVLKSSICTGEKVAGFQNNHTGKFQEDMLIRSEEDLETFKEIYDITTDIKTIY